MKKFLLGTITTAILAFLAVRWQRNLSRGLITQLFQNRLKSNVRVKSKSVSSFGMAAHIVLH